MNTSHKPLAHDPYIWLLQQIQEAAEFIPGATLADGLEWALLTLEYGEAEGDLGREVSDALMTALLDKTAKYRVWAPDECYWRFVYEPHNDWSGVTWSWVAYRKQPGGQYTCQGPWSEIEVFNRLVLYGKKLEKDDLIDACLFAYSGGLEDFLAKNRIPWELEESQKEDKDE